MLWSLHATTRRGRTGFKTIHPHLSLRVVRNIFSAATSYEWLKSYMYSLILTKVPSSSLANICISISVAGQVCVCVCIFSIASEDLSCLAFEIIVILMWDLHELTCVWKEMHLHDEEGWVGVGGCRLMTSSVSRYERDYIFEQDTGCFSFALFIAPSYFLNHFDHWFLTGAHFSTVSSKSTVRRTIACISGFSSIYDSSALRHSDMRGLPCLSPGYMTAIHRHRLMLTPQGKLIWNDWAIWKCSRRADHGRLI